MLERARTWTEVGRWHGIDATLTLDFHPEPERLPGGRDVPGARARGRAVPGVRRRPGRGARRAARPAPRAAPASCRAGRPGLGLHARRRGHLVASRARRRDHLLEERRDRRPAPPRCGCRARGRGARPAGRTSASPTSRAWSVISTTTERRSVGCGRRRTWPSRSSRSSIADVAGALSCMAALSWPGVVGLAELRRGPSPAPARSGRCGASRPRGRGRDVQLGLVGVAPQRPDHPQRLARGPAARRLVLPRAWSQPTLSIVEKFDGGNKRIPHLVGPPPELGRGAGRDRALRRPARRRGDREEPPTTRPPTCRRTPSPRRPPGSRTGSATAEFTPVIVVLDRGGEPLSAADRRAVGALGRGRSASSRPPGQQVFPLFAEDGGPPSSPCRSPRTRPRTSSASRWRRSARPPRRGCRTACAPTSPAGRRSPSTSRRSSTAPTSRLLITTAGVVALLLLITYRSPWLWLVPLTVVGVADQVAAKLLAVGTHVFGFAVDGADHRHHLGAGLRRRHQLRAADHRPLPRGAAPRGEPVRRDARRPRPRRPRHRRQLRHRRAGPALPRLRGQPLQPQHRLRRRDRHRHRRGLRAARAARPR